MLLSMSTRKSQRMQWRLPSHTVSQAASQAVTPPHNNECLPNVAHTHHSHGPPLFSCAHCTIFCPFAHPLTPFLLQATSTAHLSTLPPTLTCPSAQPPSAQCHSPVFPATHLICEPYVPLMCSVSQAPSMCLPPSGILLCKLDNL